MGDYMELIDKLIKKYGDELTEDNIAGLNLIDKGYENIKDDINNNEKSKYCFLTAIETLLSSKENCVHLTDLIVRKIIESTYNPHVKRYFLSYLEHMQLERTIYEQVKYEFVSVSSNVLEDILIDDLIVAANNCDTALSDLILRLGSVKKYAKEHKALVDIMVSINNSRHVPLEVIELDDKTLIDKIQDDYLSFYLALNDAAREKDMLLAGLSWSFDLSETYGSVFDLHLPYKYIQAFTTTFDYYQKRIDDYYFNQEFDQMKSAPCVGRGITLRNGEIIPIKKTGNIRH